MLKGKNLLVAVLLIVATCHLNAQNLSYTCPRDTILGCGNPCITLTAQFPDIKSLASDYIVTNVSPISQCRPYVDPGGAGPSANIADDDIYSSLITLPFGFFFYGNTYNTAIISPNGVVSFDISKAGQFAHYATTAGNLPNGAYDASIIMGLYHDMDIRETISPNRKIKYNSYGTAPNRKWILSFYKMPLFYNGNGCNVFYENTHQIVIHESSGIIEVYVNSRQSCAAWQGGRGMIGIQDQTKTKGVMPPGRAANDPTWQGVPMNETWRFIPKNGAPLYRGVQLLDANGAVVATGDTTRVNASTFQTSFPNVCPPQTGTNIYVVKTTYQKINDPNVLFYSLDTIRVVRQPTLPITTSFTPTACGTASGSITAVPNGGVGPYQYSINSGTAQSTGTFTGLAAGTYGVTVTDNAGCTKTDSVTVTSISSLTSTNVTTATTCPGVSNGGVTITPTAGTSPYTYVLDGTVTQTNGIFSNLSAGTHTVVFTDANNCSGTTTFSVSAGTGLSASGTTTATSCPGVNNGSISITPINGTAPYQYSLDGGAYQSSGNFNGVSAGAHLVTIRDATNCTGTRSVTVTAGISLIGSTTFTPATCSGVNNGTITITMTNGTAPYTYILDGGTPSNNNVFTGVAPGAHTISIRDATGCSTLRSVNVTVGTGITANPTFTSTSCPGVNNGTITINTTNGTAPFTFVMDNTITQVGNNVFTNVSAGTHSIRYTDANGCNGLTAINVLAGTAITGSATSTATFCPAMSDGTVTVTATSGAAPFTYSIDGGTYQSNNTFPNIAAGNHFVNFKDNAGCIGTATIIVASGPPITGTAAPTSTTCNTAADGIITVSPTTGASPYSYTLDGGTSQSSNIFNGVTNGPHAVTFTDANGCVGTASATVDPGPPLTGNATTSPTSCPTAANGSVQVSASGGAGPYTFTINPGNITQTGAPTTTFTGLVAGTYTVTYNSSNGCNGTISPDPAVIAGPPITATVNVVNPPCYGINDGTIEIIPNSGAAPFTFTLGTQTQTGNSSTIYTNLSAITYSYTYTDAAGCQGTGNAMLTTHLPIAATLTGTMPLCNGASNGSVSVAATGGVTPYQYSLDGGTTYQPGNVLTNLATGLIQVRVKDSANCVNDFTLNLSEPTLLVASTDTIASTCVGNDGTITINASGGTPNYSYSINNGASYSPSNLFIVADGTYNNIIVKDANNCTVQTSAIVTRIDNMYLWVEPIDTTICVGSPATLRPQTNPATSVFHWSTPDAPGSINNDTLKYPSVTPQDTAHYILQAFLGVCERKDTIQVNVLHKPIPYAGADTAICFDQRLAFLHGDASDVSGPVSYSWSPSDSLYTPNDQTTYGLVDSSTTYTLTVRDNYGCNFSVTDFVRVNKQPPVPAFAGNDTTAPTGQPIQLHASGGAYYLWSPATLLNNAVTNNPIATLQNDQRFIVFVTDIAGCVGSDTVFIKVYDGPQYYVPNAFSPNGDGLNDIFRVVPVGIESTAYLRIFNRFGNLVFETNQFMRGWDGTYQGRPQPIGTYVYVLKGVDKNGKLIELKGTLTLVR